MYVSDAELTIHSYSKGRQTEELHKEVLAPGEHKIEFKEPCQATSAGEASILKSAYNYAIINVPASVDEVVITGYKYVDNQSILAHIVEELPSGETKNVAKVEQATLLQSISRQQIAEDVFLYNQLRYKNELPFILQDERVGQWISIENSPLRYTKNFCARLTIDLANGLKTSGVYLTNGEIWVNDIYIGEMYAGENIGVI